MVNDCNCIIIWKTGLIFNPLLGFFQDVCGIFFCSALQNFEWAKMETCCSCHRNFVPGSGCHLGFYTELFHLGKALFRSGKLPLAGQSPFEDRDKQTFSLSFLQLPFTTMLALLLLWFGISLPLVFLGYYFGYRKYVSKETEGRVG
jgi:hypothetical protein